MPWSKLFQYCFRCCDDNCSFLFQGLNQSSLWKYHIWYKIWYHIWYHILYRYINIGYDIGYNITYDISIFNIGYDIICYIRYNISILVYITCLNCSMKRNAWWWRSFLSKYIFFSSNKFYNFVNRYVLPKPHWQQKIATKKFWGALLSFVCG